MLLQRNFTDSAARSNGFGKQRFQYSRVVFPSGFVLGPRPSAAAISKAPLHPVNISHDRQNEGFCFSRAHFSLISLISNNTRYPPPPLPPLPHSLSEFLHLLPRQKQNPCHPNTQSGSITAFRCPTRHHCRIVIELLHFIESQTLISAWDRSLLSLAAFKKPGKRKFLLCFLCPNPQIF